MTAENDKIASPSDFDDLGAVSARTELLRAAADDELTASQAYELEQHLREHPEDRRVIEFERALRRVIAGAASQAAPAHLQDRIARLYGSAGAAGSTGEVRPVTSLRPRFARPSRMLALAATVAIVATGVIVVVGPSLSESPGTVAVSPQYRTSLVSFIGSQHEECELHADQIGPRFKTSDMDEVPAEFGRILGEVPDVGRMGEHGFTLLGAGPCAVPGRGESVRMVFESSKAGTPGDTQKALVSIHIQQDTGELSIKPGRTYRLTDAGTRDSGPSEILVWRRDGFVYFLTSWSESAMQLARRAMGAGSPTGTI